MLWAPVLVLLGSWCSGCSSQKLSQLPSVSVSPGGTVKLTCALSSGHLISSGRVSWYQQKDGGVPVFVYHYYTSSDQGRGAGIPDRFSVTADTSGNLWNLVIVGVQSEDDANYFCASWYSSSFIFGGGTQMNVLSGETKPPALNVFPPSSEEVATNKATLVCLMSDFYPGSVTVTWKADDQTISSGVETTRPSKQMDNNLFMASSYLSVPTADWSTGKKYTCQATHESKIIEKSVKHSECV